jgi:hypothetical protein
MDTKKKTGKLPARLERTRRRFEQWRQTRTVRTRIPDALWEAAVKMADIYGVCRTAKTLRLHYYTLKERVDKQAAARSDSRNECQATFLELAVPAQSGRTECILELENAAGAKMRVHLKDAEAPDLVALSRSFWEGEL